MSYAIHNQNPVFNDSAIAQYMNTDFIVLDISLCVALAREQFFEKLKTMIFRRIFSLKIRVAWQA